MMCCLVLGTAVVVPSLVSSMGPEFNALTAGWEKNPTVLESSTVTAGIVRPGSQEFAGRHFGSVELHFGSQQRPGRRGLGHVGEAQSGDPCSGFDMAGRSLDRVVFPQQKG